MECPDIKKTNSIKNYFEFVIILTGLISVGRSPTQVKNKIASRYPDMSSEEFNYDNLLFNIRQKIIAAQHKAINYANQQLLTLYWEIGREIEERKSLSGWGGKVIHQLATDLKNELTDVRGFSLSNLKKMSIFYRAYPNLGIYLSNNEDSVFSQMGSGQIKEDVNVLKLLPLLSWSNNYLLIEQVKDLKVRSWYIQKCQAENWNYETLYSKIKRNEHLSEQHIVSNFEFVIIFNF